MKVKIKKWNKKNDWMMKLKVRKTSIKFARKKLKIKKNKDQNKK